MLRTTSRFFATAASVVALFGVCSIASAQPVHRHELHRLESRLSSLRVKKDREVARHHMRAAARTQGEINAVRAEIRAIRRH